MNRANSSNDDQTSRPAFGTQLPASFAGVPEESSDRPSVSQDSTPVTSSAHGTFTAPPAVVSDPAAVKTQVPESVIRTYIPGNSEVGQIRDQSRLQESTTDSDSPGSARFATKTQPSTSKPKQPTADKSTWNLRIRERRVAGHISGIINHIPQDGSHATGLLSALVANDALPEYEVTGELGEGSMGVVYRARQTSLNRDLAIKTLKPGLSNPDYDQAMFVSEAVITAHLVHPNIVPIHDLGRTADGKLFYSMKQVSGTPWHHSIREMTLEQNLDIFLKVCDGVAFAHSRGVINRDLKPENVIVGDYGEVVVLDWGLALTTDGFARRDSVLLDSRGGGGTPVYMAPELADSDVGKVGTHTDVYLLGAMLFEILEGRGPHWLREIEQMANPDEQLNAVIWAVLHNDIETQVDNDGELMQIARNAMSTHPMDRYSTVEELQEAIREYKITGRAEELMQTVETEKSTSYSEYQSAVALYDEALRKWPSNRRAQDGDRKARKAYAELALQKGDVDLGLQILPERTDRDFEPVRKKLKSTRRNRAIMRGTWGLATVGAALAAMIAIVLYFQADSEKTRAVAAEKTAIKAEKTAITEREKAEGLIKKLGVTQEKLEEKQTEVAGLDKIAQEKVQLAEQAQADAEQAQADAATEKAAAEKSAEEAKLAKAEVADLTSKADILTKKASTAQQVADAAKKSAEEAERKAEAAIAAIDSAEAKIAVAQKAAYEAFRDQITAKTEIRKFDEAIGLIRNELDKETPNPNVNRQNLLQEIEYLSRRGGNAALDLNRRLGDGILSSDGRTLVTENKQMLTVFRAVDTTEPSADRGHDLNLAQSAKSIAISGDGNVVCVLGKKDRSVWRWSGQNYQELKLPQNADSTIGVPKPLLSPNGRHLYLVGSNSSTTLIEAYVISADSAELVEQADLCEFNPSRMIIRDSVLLPEESGIVALTNNENLQLIRLAWQEDEVQFRLQGKREAERTAYPVLELRTDFAANPPFTPKHLSISSDGSHLAVSEERRSVMILNRADASNSAKFPFTMDGSQSVTTAYDGTIQSVKFSLDNSRLLVAQIRYLWLWDKAGDSWTTSKIKGLYDDRCLAGHSEEVRVAGFLSDSKTRLLSCSKDDIIRLWDTETYGEYVASLSGQRVANIQPKPKAQQTVTANLESVARPRFLLTAAQDLEQPIRRFQQGRQVFSARFSQDSERVLVGSNDLAAHAFQTGTGERTLTASMLSPRDPFFAPEKNNFVEGHIPEIVSLMFLPPNGELLLTFDYFGSLSVWDAKDDEDGIGFEKSRLLPNHPVDDSSTGQPYEVEDPSCEVGVSKDGKWLIAGVVRNNGTQSIENSKDEYFAAIWNTDDILEAGQATPAIELKGPYKNQITAAAISPDSKMAITATRRGSFVLWDIENTKVLAQAESAHNSDAVSGVFFVSNTEFISAGFDGGVLRWQIKDGQLNKTSIERPAGQSDPDFIIRLRPSPDGTRFITADLNRDRKSKNYRLTLEQWSAEKGWQSLPVSISAPQEDLGRPYRHDISWSEDGKEILYVHDGKLIVLDASTLRPTEAFQLPNGKDAVRGAIAPKGPGGMCVATFDGRQAQMWNLSDGTHLAEFRSHGPVVRAGFSADRKYVITGSDSIRVFDGDESSPDHGLPVFRLPRKIAGPNLIETVEFSPIVNDYRFASVDTAGSVRLWNWKADGAPPKKPVFDSGKSMHPGVDWLEEEEVATTSRLAWSPNGTMLAAIQRGQIRLWAVEGDGLQELGVELPADIVSENVVFNAIDFSADSKRIAVGGVLWTDDEDLESWGVEFRIEDGKAFPIAILDANRHSSAKQRNTMGSVAELRGITSIVLNDVSNEIITGGADSALLKWFAPNPTATEARTIRPSIGTKEGLLNSDGFVDPHPAPISALDVAADGSLVSADESGWIVIWPPGR
ncbi:MAG: protein kinase [Fuerstiella sp.]